MSSDMATAKWKTAKIGDVVDINPRPERNELRDNTLVSFVPMRCVEEESGRFAPLEDRRVADVKKGYIYFRDGDVLFAKVTPCMENGKAAVMKDLKNGVGFGSTEFFVLRPKNGCLNSDYLLHFLLRRTFRDDAARHMTGAVGLRRVPKSFMENQEIPLPSLDDQRRIVAEIEKQFSRLDAGVAALNRVQANLQRYRAAVLKAACEGKLVPTEAELARQEGRDYEPADILLQRILNERRKNWTGRGKYKEPEPPNTIDFPLLPEGWVYVTVETLGSVQLGRQRAPKHHSGANMRPYLRVANVYEDRFDFRDVKSMNFTPAEYRIFALQPNDILLNEGQSLELVGRPAIYRGEVPGACFQNTLVRFRPSALISPQFGLHVFRAYLHSGRFQKIAKWTTNIAHLGSSRFAKLAFPLPPLNEQARIVAEVERCLSTLLAIEATIVHNSKHSAQLRNAVLRKFFGGARAVSANAKTKA